MLQIRQAQIVQLSKALRIPAVAACPDERTWVEIVLVDDDDNPVPDIAYEIKLPDGSIIPGRLNSAGVASYHDIVAGTCQIRFPDLPDEEWRPA
jgi:hypothetical protein